MDSEQVRERLSSIDAALRVLLSSTAKPAKMPEQLPVKSSEQAPDGFVSHEQFESAIASLESAAEQDRAALLAQLENKDRELARLREEALRALGTKGMVSGTIGVTSASGSRPAPPPPPREAAGLAAAAAGGVEGQASTRAHG